MKRVSKKTLQVFQAWGARGGKKRARGLSAARRRAIAQRAAGMRWARKTSDVTAMQSVRLAHPCWSDPVYLEEVLSYGSLDAWRDLRRVIADRPFGSEAMALEKVLAATKIYGVTPLWRRILRREQGDLL